MDQTVTVEVVDGDGSVQNTQTEVLAPQRVIEVSGGNLARYCRFSGASSRRVRAAGCVFDINLTRCITIVEAR